MSARIAETAEKVKIYVVGVLACRNEVSIQPDGSVKFDPLTKHLVWIEFGENLAEAIRSAKKRAFKLFPKDQHWTHHHACFHPVTHAFLNYAVQAYAAGQLVVDDEDFQSFYLDDRLDD